MPNAKGGIVDESDIAEWSRAPPFPDSVKSFFMPNPPSTPLRSLETSAPNIRKLGVMAKVAIEGKVKTRLGDTIGFDKSAQIHQRFLKHLFGRLQDWGDERHWVASPIESISRTTFTPPSQWRIIDQGGGNLGDRIRRWFADHVFDRPALPRTNAVLIGADCPLLSHADLDEAARLFRECDLVLGPAADGGYYLIGLSGSLHSSDPTANSEPHQRTTESDCPRPGIPSPQQILDTLWNDIPWSTDEVFDRTVAAAESIGLRVSTLPVRSDVDTEEDLTALLHQIEHPVDNEEVPSDDIELARDLRRILSDQTI
ncbi:TIGR04282 family arsenosugar biosynthesis glycosyltransferase [Rhodopirellula bahusiensis]|uniref:TIGR04282 family arsenosugar biosynthesis glycosyltransferase n=2 Tax=Rhodopirellula bahusiensis TaxID=2014065 RepID=UPI003265EB02